MRITVGSDHAGLELKAAVIAHLQSKGHDVTDVGTHTAASCDYPVFAQAVAKSVVSGEAERGILVCGTGQGMAMAANKIPGVRAAVVNEPFSARAATEHNDAKILCLGARVVGVGVALMCVDAWLGVEFARGRHANRVALLEGGG